MAMLFGGGLLFDGDGTLRSGHGVVVDGGRIVRVAPLADIDLADHEYIDTAGCTLLPGLIDCHVHLCSNCDAGFVATILATPLPQLSLLALQMGQETLRGGVTTVRDLGSYEFLDIQVRNNFREGKQLGPTMLCAGKSITMTGGHAHWLSFEVDGSDAAVRAVRANIKQGADVIKLIATGGVATANVDPLAAHLTREELTAAVAEAHRLGRKAAAHAQGAPGIRNALDAGIDSIEHGFQITDELVARMVKDGTFLVPTLSAIQRTLENAVDRMPQHMLQKSMQFRDMQQASFRRFIAAGGRVAMGTDAGTPFNYHGRNAEELRAMNTLGMTVPDCLRSATGVAADLLGVHDRGRIREGYAADLLLVEGDAGVDIEAVANRARHRLVLKDGFDVFRILGRPGKLPTEARFLRGDAPF